MTDVPTPEEVAAARATLAAAATSVAQAPQKALIDLVTSPEFEATYDKMVTAQALNPANTELSYAISMMARLKAGNTPT